MVFVLVVVLGKSKIINAIGVDENFVKNVMG